MKPNDFRKHGIKFEVLRYGLFDYRVHQRINGSLHYLGIGHTFWTRKGAEKAISLLTFAYIQGWNDSTWHQGGYNDLDPSR